MLGLLIDTCVWLDIAKDYRQEVTLRYLDQLIDSGQVRLIVPRQVIDEFARNRDRIIKENTRSLSSVFKRVKDTVSRFGDESHREATLAQLNDVDHRIATLSEAVIGNIEEIEALFEKAEIFETSDHIKLRAADRAITGRAPFHKKKNSFGDAIVIETFSDAVSAISPHDELAFVTHNTRDFSVSVGDIREPHPDIAELFMSDKVKYSTGLAQILNELEPELLDEVKFELEYADVPRRLSELLEAEREFELKVWYNRHWGRRIRIEEGKIRLEHFPIIHSHIRRRRSSFGTRRG
jgi:PIN domain